MIGGLGRALLLCVHREGCVNNKEQPERIGFSGRRVGGRVSRRKKCTGEKHEQIKRRSQQGGGGGWGGGAGSGGGYDGGENVHGRIKTANGGRWNVGLAALSSWDR